MHPIPSAKHNFPTLHSSCHTKATHGCARVPCAAGQSTVAACPLRVPCTSKSHPWLVSGFPCAPHQHPQHWHSAISALPASSRPCLPPPPRTPHAPSGPGLGTCPSPSEGTKEAPVPPWWGRKTSSHLHPPHPKKVRMCLPVYRPAPEVLMLQTMTLVGQKGGGRMALYALAPVRPISTSCARRL